MDKNSGFDFEKLICKLELEFGSSKFPSSFLDTYLFRRRKENRLREKIEAIDWHKVSIDEVVALELDPLRLTADGYQYLIPKMLVMIFRFGQEFMSTYVAHTFLYVVYYPSFAKKMIGLSILQRQIFWECIDSINSILTSDKSYWLENRADVKKHILND